MCAFDVPDKETRDKLLTAFLQEKLLMAGCGEKGVRFRPHLNVSADEIAQGIAIIRKVLTKGVYPDLKIFQDPCIGIGT